MLRRLFPSTSINSNISLSASKHLEEAEEQPNTSIMKVSQVNLFKSVVYEACRHLLGKMISVSLVISL